MKNYFFKILVAGPGGAGKTSLLRQYIKNKFNDSQLMTIGVDFYLKELQIDPDINISLQLWDFGGQKHFQDLHKQYVDGAKGALLLIDLTRVFQTEKVKKWVDIVRMKKDDLPIVFIANKVDLEDKIKVKDEELNGAMQEFKMETLLKTSAKTGENVDKAFETIAKVIYNHKND
ncbi:MAG: GTP-binding protein [Promethearchaeota archaeon]|nr:MAG: GTP-binding protein [Candidatus Lokiarchaeota archaeon]